jgi:hypothetical protein
MWFDPAQLTKTAISQPAILAIPANLPSTEMEEPPKIAEIAATNGANIEGDERRTCEQCSNLAGRGRCLAAWRGEIVANRDYAPIRDFPRRCEGYMPEANDPDRRPGSERWPELIEKGCE